MPCVELTREDRERLLGIAREAIEHHLSGVRAWRPDLDALAPALRAPAASFVTLTQAGRLRGCIGTLQARQPLAHDVAEQAGAAALHDPRFPALTTSELGRTRIAISVLGEPEPLPCATEAELVQRLRPGEDGLILSAPGHRGTFLPSVWEGLPDPLAFLRALKRKAGLPEDYWSPELRVERYGTQYFAEPGAG